MPLLDDFEQFAEMGFGITNAKTGRLHARFPLLNDYNDYLILQYLRHLDRVNGVVYPPQYSHLGDHLIDRNRTGHLRKQF